MKTAQYGRMRAGKCISGEGYIGCQADVMPYLDSLCSGRHSCKVEVTEIRDVALPCKKDFTSYLEVNYECVKSEWTRMISTIDYWADSRVVSW